MDISVFNVIAWTLFLAPTLAVAVTLYDWIWDSVFDVGAWWFFTGIAWFFGAMLLGAKYDNIESTKLDMIGDECADAGGIFISVRGDGEYRCVVLPVIEMRSIEDITDEEFEKYTLYD